MTPKRLATGCSRTRRATLWRSQTLRQDATDTAGTGYAYVTLDLEGLRSGNLNAALGAAAAPITSLRSPARP